VPLAGTLKRHFPRHVLSNTVSISRSELDISYSLWAFPQVRAQHCARFLQSHLHPEVTHILKQLWHLANLDQQKPGEPRRGDLQGLWLEKGRLKWMLSPTAAALVFWQSHLKMMLKQDLKDSETGSQMANKKMKYSWVLVAPTCNFRYLGGWTLEYRGSRPVWAKRFVRLPSQQKKLSVVACTCHPSCSSKCKNRKIAVQVNLGKKQDPISKVARRVIGMDQEVVPA
jgi:hypothetical protein